MAHGCGRFHSWLGKLLVSRLKLFSIPSFVQSGPPAPRMVSPMFRVDLLNFPLDLGSGDIGL